MQDVRFGPITRRSAVAAALALALAGLPPVAQAQVSSVSANLRAARASVDAVLDPPQRAEIAGIAARTQAELDAAIADFRTRSGRLASELTWSQRMTVFRARAAQQEPSLTLDDDQRARIVAKARTLATACGPALERGARAVAAILRPSQRTPLARVRTTFESATRERVRAGSLQGEIAGGIAPLLALYDAPDLGFFVLSAELDIDEFLR